MALSDDPSTETCTDQGVVGVTHLLGRSRRIEHALRSGQRLYFEVIDNPPEVSADGAAVETTAGSHPEFVDETPLY